MAKSKRPISDITPNKKEIRAEQDPKSSENQTPYWILSTFDYSGPWGAGACIFADCAKHLSDHLRGFESMTWAEILRASGGRSHGNNNHPIAVKDLSVNAKRRLKEIKLEDVESIFSLRFESTVRMYGIRDGRTLKILWLDPWHGDKARAVCPSSKR